jgi:DNA-binding HxlR family transcriptional regulator
MSMGKDLAAGQRWPGRSGPVDVYDELYSVRNLLGGEWELAVLCAVAHGPKRYSEILDKVQDYHAVDPWSKGHTVFHRTSLTRALHTLTNDGLLIRHEKRNSFPRSVTYSLSEPARRLLDAARPLVDWVHQHTDLILRAQAWRRDG